MAIAKNTRQVNSTGRNRPQPLHRWGTVRRGRKDYLYWLVSGYIGGVLINDLSHEV